MKRLQYYAFDYSTTESKTRSSKYFSNFSYEKLFSKMKGNYKSPEYLHNRLYFPFNNDAYSAHQRIPKETIEFYDFYLDPLSMGADDFMRASEVNPALGFFVSPKVKDILLDFVLPSHRFYPVKIHHQNKEYQHYFLLLAKDELKINYPASTFVDRFDKTKTVEVSQYKELLILKEETEQSVRHYRTANIKEQTIVFNEAPDIYPVVTRAENFYYFSERLKDELLTQQISGIEFYETEQPLFYLTKQEE